MHTDLEKVLKECAKWGVKVRFLTKNQYQVIKKNVEFSEAPFTCKDLGGNYQFQTIYVGKETKEHPEAGSWVLHELAHLIIDKSHNHAQEIDSGMLAFEYHMAQILNLEHWEESMANFGLGSEEDYRHVPQYEIKNPDQYTCYKWGFEDCEDFKTKILKYSTDMAIEAGILNKDNLPTYIKQTS